MPRLQDRPVDPHSSPHCRGLCLLTGADDRRHFMTAMSIPFPKSWPNSLALVRGTGDPCPDPPVWRSENTDFDWLPREDHPPTREGDPFRRPIVSSTRTFPSACQTDCYLIPIAPGPAQFNESYR